MSAQPVASLTARLDGELVRVLKAGCPPFTFGRGSGCCLRLGGRGQNGDRHISRTAGSLHWQDGLWTVQNDGSRAFDILDPVVVPWPPGAIWAIGPDGVELKINSPIRPYVIHLQPAGPPPGARFDPSEPLSDIDPSTFPLPSPSPHDRMLLAAKFLSRRRPGVAIGNRKAADRANAVGRTHVTPKAVEDAVRNWKERLQAIGVSGIEGRENVNQLGFSLLAYGVIRQEYALPLPPVADGDG